MLFRSRPDFEVITWKENGKWIAYEIHKDLAASILSRPTEEMMVIGNWLGKLSGNQFFRSVWITFNLGFQFGSNIWRDFFRTWKNFPHLSFIELIQKYKEALPHALNEVKGIYDPLIQQMKREKALSVTFNQLILGKTDEDSQLEYELEKMGVIEPKTGKFDHIPVAKAISQFFDTIRFIGDVLEKTGKIAPYLSKTAQNMPPEKRAYYIRNYASTPNYLNKGTATPATNQLFLFSNMFVQGFRKDFENATNPETRGNFWMKSLIGVAMVKIIMAIMQHSDILGQKQHEIMNKQSEYIKSNYIVIPLGIDEQGNGIVITIPQDEMSRLLGAMFWKMLNGNKDLVKSLSDIFSVGAGQFPNVLPAAKILGAASQYAATGQAYDIFRQRNIITDQEAMAGGMYSGEPMIRWTINELGFSKLDVRDRWEEEPTYKKILSLTPIVNRLIRSSRQGEMENIQKDVVEPVRQRKARENLDIQSAAIDAFKKGVSKNDFVNSTIGGEGRTSRKKRENAYSFVEERAYSDPNIKALVRAVSNEEKVELLKYVKKGFIDNNNKKGYDDFIGLLRRTKIVSQDVINKSRRD